MCFLFTVNVCMLGVKEPLLGKLLTIKGNTCLELNSLFFPLKFFFPEAVVLLKGKHALLGSRSVFNCVGFSVLRGLLLFPPCLFGYFAKSATLPLFQLCQDFHDMLSLQCVDCYVAPLVSWGGNIPPSIFKCAINS